MEEKLKKANKLQKEISEIDDFILLIQQGQMYDEKNKSQNEFRYLKLTANLCTGSQSPAYSREIENGEVIKIFVNAGVGALEMSSKLKKEELQGLFR